MLLGLIPARCGSRSVKNKNIKLLAGYPLIAYSIVASKLSTKIDRTIVSTDSAEYAEIAKHYGAEVPFLRPAEYATDTSTDMDFFRHLIGYLLSKEGITPDYIVHLGPTIPLRDPVVIDEAINKIVSNEIATALRSVHQVIPAHKLFSIRRWFLEGLFPNDPRPEYYNLPRQTFTPNYKGNGYVDIVIPKTIKDTGTLHSTRILPFITEDVGDLDTLDDFEFIEWRLQKYGNVVYDYLKENYEEEM